MDVNKTLRLGLPLELQMYKMLCLPRCQQSSSEINRNWLAGAVCWLENAHDTS